MPNSISIAQPAVQQTRLKPEFGSTIGHWEYLSCSCIVKLGEGGIIGFKHECHACGNTNLRFIHTLEHCEDHRQICVGIECARALMDDWETPQVAENELKRKERWRIHYKKPGRCSVTFDELIEKGKL